MRPICEIEPDAVAMIRYILCDIDDTITTDGKLSKESFEALWRLHDAGYHVIPVTGRPAGWCDMIVRQWPVKAVIGENGAFVFYYMNDRLHTFAHPSVARGDIQEKLKAVKDACLQGVPGCRMSRDQFARVYDAAIDFNEDPPYLGFEAAEKIKEICESMGAVAKVSSIHVNTWFGDYNKLDTTRMFIKEVLHDDDIQDRVIFFGDSPNDEPMFQFFTNSCAVANIRPFVDKLRYLPRFVTTKKSGEGFAEAVNHILNLADAARHLDI